MQLDAAVQNAGVGLSQPLQRRPVPARWIHSPEGPVLLRQRLSTDRTSAATGGSRWQPGTRAGGGPTSNGRFGRDMANDDAPSAGLDQVGGSWTIPMPIRDPCGGEAASLDDSLTGGKLDRATDRAGLLLKRHQAGRGDSLRHGRSWVTTTVPTRSTGTVTIRSTSTTTGSRGAVRPTARPPAKAPPIATTPTMITMIRRISGSPLGVVGHFELRRLTVAGRVSLTTKEAVQLSSPEHRLRSARGGCSVLRPYVSSSHALA